MNLYQCQKWAEKNGFNTAEFYAYFPIGMMKCKWLDAYFGMFSIPELADKGFMMVSQIDDMFPNLICTPIETEEEQT
jgi:hypothetical protein